MAALEGELIEEIRGFYAYPLGFVKFAYPWGDRGVLENYSGPDAWQRDLLIEIGEQVQERNFDGEHSVAPIRQAIASGHGIVELLLERLRFVDLGAAIDRRVAGVERLHDRGGRA